jgi:hypothetical protein
VLTLAINNVGRKEEAAMEFAKDVAEFQAYTTPSRLPVMFGAFVSRIERNTLIIFRFLT